VLSSAQNPAASETREPARDGGRMPRWPDTWGGTRQKLSFYGTLLLFLEMYRALDSTSLKA
jgi:hypothetical protein